MKTSTTLPFDPRYDLMANAVKRTWVNCPICGEPDVRREEDKHGNALILCVNHACGSNGGTNFDALKRERPVRFVEEKTVAVMAQEVADYFKNLTDSS